MGDLARLVGLDMQRRKQLCEEETLEDALVELSAWDERMIEAAVSKQGVSKVLEIAAEQLANPIALFDSSLALVAHAGDLPEGRAASIWDEVLAQGYSPIEFYSESERADVARRLVPHGAPQLFFPQRSAGHVNLAALVTVGEKPFGSIGQVDLIKPFDDLEIALAGHVRDRIEQALAVGVGEPGKEDELASLVGRAVRGEPVDDTVLDFHLLRTGWNPAGPWLVAVCPLPLEGDHAESLARRSVAERVARSLPRSISIEHEGALVAVCAAESWDRESATVAKTLAALGLSCGLSWRFDDLSQASVYYRQARIALERSEGMGASGIVLFADAYTAHAVRSLVQSDVAEVWCHHAVLELVRNGYKGDIVLGRELVEQLYAFISCGCNLREASRNLFVHRNTLAYRMERLSELLGIDVSHVAPHEAFMLELSCLIALGGDTVRFGSALHR